METCSECQKAQRKIGQTDLIEKLTSDDLAFLLIGISESYYMDCQQIRESGFGDEQYKRKLWREEIKAAIKKAGERS